MRRALANLDIDVDELERRLMVKMEHRLIALLVGAEVLAQGALDDFERRHRIGIRRDAEVANRALGMVPNQQPGPAEGNHYVGS